MKQRYFLIGTIIGLFCAIIEGVIIAGPKFFNLFLIFNSAKEKYNSLLPLCVGIAVTLIAAFIFDRFIKHHRLFMSSVLIPASIFCIGTLIGCLANFLTNAKPGEFFDYFMEPLYWIMLFGVPSAILVGIVYFNICKKLKKIS